MSTTHTSLDAAAVDRKARLAKLASLKRKQPGAEIPVSAPQDGEHQDPQISKTDTYLSGRNYDTVTKNAKLGFENTPVSNEETVEEQANRITASITEQAVKEELEAEKGIDLFKLQPKKPNWDLKRDLAEKMKIVDVRTQNAIARLVRERIENAKKENLGQGMTAQPTENGEQGEEVGIEGTTLVEGIRLREQEEREVALDDAEDIP